MAPARRFALFTLVAGALAALTYLALVLASTGQQLENLALRGARQELDFVKQEALGQLSEISIAGFVVAIVIVVTVAVLRRKAYAGIVAVLIMVISVGLAEILKRLLVVHAQVAAGAGLRGVSRMCV